MNAPASVEFGVDGAIYEIDLSEANAAKLRDALADYIAHARRVIPEGAGSVNPANSGS